MQFETRTEIMIILFVALPDGPEVNSITYRLNDPSISYANLSEPPRPAASKNGAPECQVFADPPFDN